MGVGAISARCSARPQQEDQADRADVHHHIRLRYLLAFTDPAIPSTRDCLARDAARGQLDACMLPGPGPLSSTSRSGPDPTSTTSTGEIAVKLGLGPRSRVAIGLAGLAAVAIVLLIGGGGGPARPRFAFGGFGGYLWAGRVRSVAASWAVPAIAGGSSAGRASTWVGAQAPSPTAASNPFIQVGTIEVRRSPRQGQPQDGYFAFWSDTKHGFHLQGLFEGSQGLFEVNPGDEISASLTLSHHRWTVEILDATSGQKSRFSTRDETQASFNRAEWMQENTGNDAGKRYPYPRLSTLRIRDLAVNSTRPGDADLYSQWMSTDDGLLGPTPLQGDSFAIRRQTLSSPARRYLAIVTAPSPAAAIFLDHFARWTRATQRSQIASATSAFITAEHDNINALTATRWPPAAQPLIDLNIRERQREISQARSAVTSAELPAWKSAMISDLETSRRTIRLLRRALDLPDISPSPG